MNDSSARNHVGRDGAPDSQTSNLLEISGLLEASWRSLETSAAHLECQIARSDASLMQALQSLSAQRARLESALRSLPTRAQPAAKSSTARRPPPVKKSSVLPAPQHTARRFAPSSGSLALQYPLALVDPERAHPVRRKWRTSGIAFVHTARTFGTHGPRRKAFGTQAGAQGRRLA